LNSDSNFEQIAAKAIPKKGKLKNYKGSENGSSCPVNRNEDGSMLISEN
jgi:hypothetical protein